MRFKDKIVIISGASSGIGHALSVEMARRGARGVALLARRLDALKIVAEGVEAHGCRALPLVCDVGSFEDVTAAVARCAQELGPIDIVIANAGMGQVISAFEPNQGAIEQIMDVNFLGSARLINAALPAMVARRRGHIVGISSLAGLRGMPRGGGYCASKAALGAFLESYRVELDLIDLPVTTVYPGYVRTPITEDNDIQPRFMIEADAAARIIADGIEADRADIRFPLVPMLFMSWLSHMPAFIFDRVTRFLARARLKVPPPALPPGQG